jgi:hypothetical protein
MSWICATFVLVFNKFFQLGFLLMRPRTAGAMTEKDDVEPLASRHWPALLLPIVICSPSTNFSLSGGNLTYPYYARPFDRFPYILYALFAIFGLDRISRSTPCEEMPSTLVWSSLFLYIFHPEVISVLMTLGVTDVYILWFGSALIIYAIVSIVCAVHGALGRDDSEVQDEEDEYEEESEESEELLSEEDAADQEAGPTETVRNAKRQLL